MKYIVFCILAMLVSCSKEKPKNEVIDTSIDIFVENADGQNLMLPTTPNAIIFDSLRLMYLINGNTVNVNDPNMDCPRNICHVTDAGSERIRLFPNDKENEEFPVTFIRWGNEDLDTIKCHFIRKDNGINSSIVCDKVWFNGLLMFPDNAVAGLGRAFKVVK